MVLDLGVDQRGHPRGPRVGIDEHRSDEQRHRHGQERAQRAEQERPHHQGHEGDLGAEPDRVADDARLDERLDRHVEDAVGQYHQQQPLPPIVEERQEGGRDDADDETDVGDEVRQEREESPDQRQRDADEPQGTGVEHADDGAEERCHQQVGLGPCMNFPMAAASPGLVRWRAVTRGCEARHGDDEEEHQRHQEEQEADRIEDPRDQVAQHPGELRRVQLRERVTGRGCAQAELGEAVLSVLRSGPWPQRRTSEAGRRT